MTPAQREALAYTAPIMKTFMIEWFYSTYEDPVESCPYDSAEGGYQYIWGEPSDANEIIQSQFGGIFSETLMNEVVEYIEETSPDTDEWVPIPRAEDYAVNEQGHD